jgi:hypothetical protein
MEQLPRVSVGLQAGIDEKGMRSREMAKVMMGRMGQDFVVTRTKSIGNGCSMGVDFREKGFYSSYTPDEQVSL